MRRNLPELFSHSLRGARPCISFLVSVIPYAAVRSTIRTTSDFALVFIFARRRELSDTFGDTTYTRTDPNYPKSVSKVFDFLAAQSHGINRCVKGFSSAGIEFHFHSSRRIMCNVLVTCTFVPFIRERL